ncbi:tail fiber assembly protein [Escherichia coli]|uniref:tail fiber assembly protein n=1 Tax=Escherichia coli TaxID=562 RepID=UPI0018684761|nr:tail fiber assembly protein [Escherichia coli]EIL5950599.1 tail fiber assembly protein [Escherichia coli]MBS8599342.1 tail fiber assembly protein [Escherichia coli]MCN4947267.1 tail fiber assembly protein [Escherichia coli]MCN6294773.1 tail fiber assembly protein [Escherichia coli]MCV1039881.1 tail fiber assembly protein [Escherichia coli]
MNVYNDSHNNRPHGFIWDGKNLRLLAYVLKSEYELNGMWPADGIDITEEVAYEFIKQPPEGKVIGVNEEGMPAWIDKPPITHAEEVIKANNEKHGRIVEAVNYMNSKQWVGKAILGRLDVNEMKMYNVWLDYLEKLEAVDPSTAPNIIFPDKPC